MSIKHRELSLRSVARDLLATAGEECVDVLLPEDRKGRLKKFFKIPHLSLVMIGYVRLNKSL